jgi:hypothetical protein
MITNVPITSGLQARLSSMGCSLSFRDNQPVCLPSTDAVLSVIDGWTLDDAKAEVIAQIDAHAAALRDHVVAGTSPAEMSTWTIKRDEARAYNGTDASSPTLAAEAMARGVSTQAVVDRVNLKAAMLLQIEANIAGIAGRHGDAIRAMTSYTDIAAYDYSTDWPTL